MRKFVGAALVAAALSFAGWMSLAPASAAPPVATGSPGYDARLAAAKPTDVSARRRHYRRYGYYRPYYRRYYRPYPYYRPYYYGYRPFYRPYLGYGYGYRPYYYRPYGYGYGYGYRPYGFGSPFYGPGFGFGFGW